MNSNKSMLVQGKTLLLICFILELTLLATIDSLLFFEKKFSKCRDSANITQFLSCHEAFDFSTIILNIHVSYVHICN